PNLVYMVLRYNKDVYAWDTPWEYCQSVLTTDDFCYLTTKSFIDTVHCFTERKYRVYAVDTLSQLTSCYSSEINVDILTNISELEKNKGSEILVYPNPNNGSFELTIDAPFQQAKLIIFDLTGKVIVQQKITQNNTQLNLLSHPKGMYFYQLLIDGEQVTGKMIVQ
ncbi:MAG: T9SS type A sorting domain-containing protein, partial [Vicingaceae bacterium]|nr:T9SS type A sorting domain-containing protein [Vicingaceae bacterium]